MLSLLIIRAKEPKNMEARKRRAEYILKEEEMKAECIAAGRDWNIEKLRYASMHLILLKRYTFPGIWGRMKPMPLRKSDYLS